KLAFELLDRTRERRLRHVALFRRAREVQFLRDRKKIADLMHFHDALTCKVDRGPVAEVVGIGFAYSPGRIIRSKTCNQNNGVFLQCSNHAAECLLGVLTAKLSTGWNTSLTRSIAPDRGAGGSQDHEQQYRKQGRRHHRRKQRTG